MHANPKVSVIVVNFGFPSFLRDCIGSLTMVDNREGLQIVLVDNGSSASDRLKVRGLFNELCSPGDKLVEVEGPSGYGSGVNAGVAMTAGEIVVALNSDVYVGRGLIAVLLKANENNGDHAALFAVPVYCWHRRPDILSDEVQAEVVVLTVYCSCLPVRRSEVKSHYVLGPPGPVVTMNREFIRVMQAAYGFVYDPKFFMYGEDVDLFLRARRMSIPTVYIAGDFRREEHIWHLGSASTADEQHASTARSPRFARMVLDGCQENAWTHSGWLEFPIVMVLQLVFKMVFYLAYARRNGLKAALELSRTRGRKPQRALSMNRRPAFLLSSMGMAYRFIFYWARGTSTGLAARYPPSLSSHSK